MFQAKIIRTNGDIILGDFDCSKGIFHFNISINHDLEKCLSIKNNMEGGYTISYIYSGDYMPRLFPLEKGVPLVIDDFYSFDNDLDEHIKLEIIYG